MRSSSLAFEAPFVCSLVCFAAAILFVHAWRVQVHAWRIVLAALGWLCWTLYFALLAITAGPAPMLERGEVALAARWAELGGGLLLGGWLLLWMRRMWG